MSQVLESKPVGNKAAEPERARRTPGPATQVTPSSPLPLQTLLYLQKFAGSLEGQRASKGVFITTSSFSAGARQYVDRISRRIVLIDGPTLARYMYDYGIGVRSKRSLDVKGVDEPSPVFFFFSPSCGLPIMSP